MDNYLSKLNTLTEDKYTYLRVFSADVILKDNLLDIVLLVPQDIIDFKLKDEDKALILSSSAKIIPYPFKVRITYRKSFPDTTFILRDILDFINEKYPALNSAIKESNISIAIADEIIKIGIMLENSAYSYLKHSEAEDKIKKFLSHKYCNPIEFSYVTKEDSMVIEETIIEETITKSNLITVTRTECLIGREISSQPRYIKSITSDNDRTVLCGRIKSIAKLNKREGNDVFYSFLLDDTTATIKALYFPKLWQGKNTDDKSIAKAKKEFESKIATLDKLVDSSGMGDFVVICEGNIKLGNNNELTYFVNNISSCLIDFSTISSNIVKMKVPENYTTIIPTPYIDTMPSNSLIVPNYLKNKRIVVFDFETTGINPLTEVPIELGAVSIVNGRITEQFSTFINPMREISPEITKITHISNTDVINSPIFEDVIPDFYKFCHNSILVAHNTEFDYSFLKKAAEPMGYIFNNERQDTLIMSRKVLKGLEKYSLENICNKLGIINEGAHRAIFDAIATARLYIILIEKM